VPRRVPAIEEIAVIAAWYERQGPARDVLVVGEVDDPQPGPGEVRLRVAWSGINPGDIKKRENAFGYGMPSPRVIPHSDGAGTIDQVGAGVPAARLGQRVWCYGAQSYRPFGTAAQYVVVPAEQAVPLPDAVSFAQGACLGIPGITAHRAVHCAGALQGRTVLVQGAAGAVGTAAVVLSRQAGARVVAGVRSAAGAMAAMAAGADRVVRLDQGAPADIVQQLGVGGVHHVVEVDLAANIALDEQLLAVGGSIGAYASGSATPQIPFWLLLFKNITLHFLGSDDFPPADKAQAALALNAALQSGWAGYADIHLFALADIAAAHERVASGAPGRTLLKIDG
jgi:NADPH2:quinone reductase